MQALSMNPRVAQLTAQRELFRAGAHLQKAGAVPKHRLLVHALRRAIAADSDMALAQVVATPIGSLTADIVLQRTRRRIAIQVSNLSSEAESALLVYGGFDAVYRVSTHDAAMSVTGVVALLESAEPALFAHRDTAFLSSLSSIRKIQQGRRTFHAVAWDGTLAASLHRRRISRPSEWANRFEGLLTQANQRIAS